MRDEERRTIEAAKALIADGHVSGVAELLSDGLGSPPKIALNPTLSDITAPEARPVFDYWQSLSKERGYVCAKDLDLLDLSDAVRYLMLLDIEDAGWQFRYRYYGEGIAERSGFDLTGSSTSDIPLTPQISMFFMACYRYVMDSKQPIYSWHAAPRAIAVACWDRLLLPLMNDEGTEVIRILGANIPGPWRRAVAEK